MGRRTLKCNCGKCRMCKDRNRKRAIASGTHVPYKAQGRVRERQAAVKRDMKLLRRILAAWKAVPKARKRGLKAARRKRRDWVFKANVARFGKDKAGMIAAIYTRRKRGVYRHTLKSRLRWKARKEDELWFLNHDYPTEYTDY